MRAKRACWWLGRRAYRRLWRRARLAWVTPPRAKGQHSKVQRAPRPRLRWKKAATLAGAHTSTIPVFEHQPGRRCLLLRFRGASPDQSRCCRFLFLLFFENRILRRGRARARPVCGHAPGMRDGMHVHMPPPSALARESAPSAGCAPARECTHARAGMCARAPACVYGEKCRKRCRTAQPCGILVQLSRQRFPQRYMSSRQSRPFDVPLYIVSKLEDLTAEHLGLQERLVPQLTSQQHDRVRPADECPIGIPFSNNVNSVSEPQVTAHPA